MKPIYEENEETLEIAEQISCHIPPHLHKSMELVSVTEGTLEIGVGTELYHMEKGDFALVFPELIHHYQVFNSESCKAIYALASPLLAPSYTKELQQFCPVNPVILAQEVHPDVNYDLGISQSSLSRVFSGTFHTNFNRYLNEARLDYACSLLLHSDHTILDICIRTGFDSQRTFNRVFQERYHMSPREYRKQPH